MLWVVSLSERYLTHRPSLPGSTTLKSSEFDSGPERELRYPESVALPREQSRLRLDFDLFRKEPAITDLD